MSDPLVSYIFWTQRPQDKEPWPLAYQRYDLAVAAPCRISDVIRVESTRRASAPQDPQGNAQKASAQPDALLIDSTRFVSGAVFDPGPRPGSVRYKRADKWVIAQPGEPLYSTALYAAEESWNGVSWIPCV